MKPLYFLLALLLMITCSFAKAEAFGSSHDKSDGKQKGTVAPCTQTVTATASTTYTCNGAVITVTASTTKSASASSCGAAAAAANSAASAANSTVLQNQVNAGLAQCTNPNT